MKTPKRKLICPNCEEEIMVEIPPSLHSSDPVFRCPSGCTLHDARYFLHGEIPELYKFARWKRKNREARLRNMIKTITQKRNNALMAVVKLMQLKNETLGGMYGQDIEGS